MNLRDLAARLRPFASFLALLGVVGLSACGGGSGSVNNPYAPPTTTPNPLAVLPASAVVYPGSPQALTATGGTPPYRAFSSNSAVLPVAESAAGDKIVLSANPVEANVSLVVTVQDAAGVSQPISITVVPAPLFNTLSMTPASADCGTNLCSGQVGTLSVSAKGAAGAPLPNRLVKFDVVFGPVLIRTSNPAIPLAQTLTVTTDATGVAQAAIEATASAPTQTAQIRATDITTGQQQVINFVVQNSTTGGQSPLTVVPDTATITTLYSDRCSAGFIIDYYLYGGNPPYRVSSTFPGSVNLVNSTVAASGGFFQAITNGTCVDPLVFTIVDAAGKQVTATLKNVPGSTAPPVPVAPAALVLAPTTALCPSQSASPCGPARGMRRSALATSSSRWVRSSAASARARTFRDGGGTEHPEGGGIVVQGDLGQQPGGLGRPGCWPGSGRGRESVPPAAPGSRGPGAAAAGPRPPRGRLAPPRAPARGPGRVRIGPAGSGPGAPRSGPGPSWARSSLHRG